MNYLRHLLLLAILGFSLGCGSGVKVEPPTMTPLDEVKATLQDVVNSGELGSGVDQLAERIEALRETDAAKADKVAAGLDELMSSRTPRDIKKHAQKMLDEL